jgi:hypothetical protein
VTVALIVAVGFSATLRQHVNPQAATEIMTAAQWVEAHTTPNDTLLIQDAGGISVFADRKAVDFVGLKSPEHIADHQYGTFASCGETRAATIAGIARRSGATYLIVTNPWEYAYKFSSGIRAAGVDIELVRKHPDPWGYDIFAIR